MASFAANVGVCRTFFGIEPSVSLKDAVAQMNESMGLSGEGTLPEQVQQLMESAGLEAPAQEADQPASGAAGSSSTAARKDVLTSLPGIGVSADPKLARSLAKWKARDLSAPPADERQQKIFAYQEKLRTPQPDDGVSTIMPSGGKSTTPSMLTCPEGSDPAEFGPFKNIASCLAASPPLRQLAPSAKALASDFRLC